ncbi:MAG: hypothetical protein DDT28_00042 [Dehalococcoidia bacterium]|nr:hypothetical protein [Chloroflexota bacterium]
MSLLPPTFHDSLFDTLDGTEPEVHRHFTPFIQELHEFLNQLPCLSGIQKDREKIKGIQPKYSEAFGVPTIEQGYWYTFNHGGRNEMQFNIGMFGSSVISPPYVRVGVAWHMGGPARKIVTNSLVSFRSLIASHLPSWGSFVNTNGLEIEWVHRVGVDNIKHTPTANVTNWLLHPPSQRYDWIFIGRLLRRDIDSAILSNPNQLKLVIESVFTGFRPLWQQTL